MPASGRRESLPPTAVRLCVHEGAGHGIELLIPPGTAVEVGRGTDRQLPDAFGCLGVSRSHASVGVDPDFGLWIRDDGSRRGTRVNADRVRLGEKVFLRIGDTVALGNLVLEVTSIAYSQPVSDC